MTKGTVENKEIFGMTDVQFANLSIRFGERELLDYKELVAGAFLKDTYIRKYGRSSYHFFETKMGLIDKGDPLSLAIWGRLVKETTLEREQYFSDGSIVQDRQSLESAPTSLFVFFVADHRLAFIPETKFAPTLGNLESTVRKFVQNEFNNWARQEYESAKEADSAFRWKDFYAEHSSPTVALVPLTARESIEAFMERFLKIESLTVYVVKRNQDLDGGALFEALVKKSEEMEASSARFVVNGTKDDGLDIENTTEFVSETTQGGYERVALRGIDENGDILKGTNEDFKLTAELDTTELSQAQLLKKVFETYNANKEAGLIRVSEKDRDALEPLLLSLIEEQDE
jgi:hypothetical protein